MSYSLPPLTLDLLRQFRFERVLNDDPVQRRVAVLGSLPTGPPALDEEGNSPPSRLPAILSFQKSHFADVTEGLVGSLRKIEVIESNDIYGSLSGWHDGTEEAPSDSKISVILNATDVHIRKATKQKMYIIRETPAIYQEVVLPYIDSLPPGRIQWVYNILDHKKESEKILWEDPSPEHGFIILPDMKWDLTTTSALYLVAIVHSKALRSIRDLRKSHIGMLRSIRREAVKASEKRWSVGADSLRMYLHYQPSYYHLHVHIVNVEMEGFAGMNVDHAHLLDDVISLLETEAEGVLARMTLTYSLNALHPLFEGLRARQINYEL